MSGSKPDGAPRVHGQDNPLEEQFLSLETRQAPLRETIHLRSQFMLQKAAELELAEFLGRQNY